MSGLRDAKEVLEYLNTETGSRYKPTKHSLTPILARLREGFSVQDLKEVVDGQKLDPYFIEHPKFFRPSTLFGSKCESYLSAAPKQRAALEQDPKDVIRKMRQDAEMQKFIGGNDAATGPGRICERNAGLLDDPRENKKT